MATINDMESYLAFVQSDIYKQNCRARKSKLTKRDRHLRARFKITESDYDFMFAAQQGRCGICRVHQSEVNRALAVDHCHETGRIRGLLCGKCNTAVGLLQDRRDLMARAARWVMTDAELGIANGPAE